MLPRFLPPLLVLLFFALIVGRCASDPFRGESQEQITGLLEGSDFEAASNRLTTYLERYQEDKDQWFAAQAWFAMRRPDKAIEQIWAHPSLPQQPETARRFAETGLLALGWSDSQRKNATGMEPNVLIALVEGGHPWATERLREHAATLPLRGTTLYFFPAFRRANAAPAAIMADVFRGRQEERFDVAAALAALKPADYPEKAGDIALLQKVVSDAKWREQWLDVWAVAAVALGRSGDAAALRTLKEVEAGLEGATSPRDQRALLLVRNGLIAGGDWSSYESVLAAALARDAAPMPTIWLLEALIHRYRVGDMRAEPGLVSFWTRLGPSYPNLRERSARAFLLQDAPPSDEAVRVWVERMVADLQRPGAPLMSRVLARAYRLRSGAAGGREGVIDALREAGRAFQADPSSAGELTNPFIEALRALYVYS